jgi:exosortase/archaeosortase family protein
VYLIQTPHGAVSASIASACSGAESVLGVLLVATASTYLLAGRLRRKLAWVGIGCALVWIGNVGRILVLFTAAHRFGPDIAFNLLHPVAGLVVMNVILVVLLASHRLFGLRLRHPGAPAAADSPLSYRAERPPRPLSLLVRVGLVAGAAYLVSSADSSLAALSGQFTNAGVTAIADFQADAHVAGPWRVSYVESFPWSRQTFGSDATWDRYMLSPLPPRGGGPPARFTVWLDSVTTPDVGALLVHTVRGCYDFHSEDVSVDRTVSLAGGVEGEQLVYRAGAARWHVVTWQWPVRHAGAVWHERVTLLASTTVRPDAPRPRRSSRGLLGRVVSAVNLFAPDHDTNPALSRALAGVADQVIAARLERRR